MSLLCLLNDPYTYARPDADVSLGGWTTDTGGTTNLFAVLDESTANDADYIKSSGPIPSNDTVEVELTTLAPTVPGTNTFVIRAYKAS